MKKISTTPNSTPDQPAMPASLLLVLIFPKSLKEKIETGAIANHVPLAPYGQFYLYYSLDHPLSHHHPSHLYHFPKTKNEKFLTFLSDHLTWGTVWL
jgi:hypothetical protein